MEESKSRAIKSLIEMSLELLNASQGAFLVADAAAAQLKFEVVAVKHGTAEPLKRVSEKLMGEIVAFGVGITGKAAATRSVQFGSRNAGADLLHVRGDGTPNAVMAVPVLSEDRLLGVMTAVCFDRELSFSSEAARQYSLAAEVAAGMLG